MKIEIVKPVIPKFVSDWIEQEKKCTTFHKSFSRAINLVKHDEDWREWEYEVGNRWSKIVATAWIHGYEIEQEIEQEPLYYAKIKGWELTSGKNIFWNYSRYNVSPMLSRFHVDNKHDEYSIKTKMTKEEWESIGINDTNADFEEV